MKVVLLMVALSVSVAAQADIRAVDFKNFTYMPACTGDPDDKPDPVTVKNGEYSFEKQEEGYVDRFYFNVFDVTYGDLNADRVEEAVVLTVCNTGGTGQFSEGFVFSLKGGQAARVARIPGGDRAYGGLRSARIENGLLIVESNDVGELGGACCPEVIVTTKYRLAGKGILRSGVPTRRPIYPQERITFDRGKSGKTFTTTIPAWEGKRFLVGARANQNLIVSVDNEKAQLRLLEDARVTEGINNFLAKLPKSGDYTVEIRNDSDAPLAVTVNIKIQ